MLPALIEIKNLRVTMPGTSMDRFLGKFSSSRKAKSQATILKGIDALIPPGCLVAILGTSGSGLYPFLIIQLQNLFILLMLP